MVLVYILLLLHWSFWRVLLSSLENHYMQDVKSGLHNRAAPGYPCQEYIASSNTDGGAVAEFCNVVNRDLSAGQVWGSDYLPGLESMIGTEIVRKRFVCLSMGLILRLMNCPGKFYYHTQPVYSNNTGRVCNLRQVWLWCSYGEIRTVTGQLLPWWYRPCWG